jgi:hypothetical protein
VAKAVSVCCELRRLRARPLIVATEVDEPINSADAVDELVVVRAALDRLLALQPEVDAVFAELRAAIAADGEASWEYAEGESNTPESESAWREVQRTRARLANAERTAKRAAGG